MTLPDYVRRQITNGESFDETTSMRSSYSGEGGWCTTVKTQGLHVKFLTCDKLSNTKQLFKIVQPIIIIIPIILLSGNLSMHGLVILELQVSVCNCKIFSLITRDSRLSVQIKVMMNLAIQFLSL